MAIYYYFAIFPENFYFSRVLHVTTIGSYVAILIEEKRLEDCRDTVEKKS